MHGENFFVCGNKMEWLLLKITGTSTGKLRETMATAMATNQNQKSALLIITNQPHYNCVKAFPMKSARQMISYRNIQLISDVFCEKLTIKLTIIQCVIRLSNCLNTPMDCSPSTTIQPVWSLNLTLESNFKVQEMGKNDCGVSSSND